MQTIHTSSTWKRMTVSLCLLLVSVSLVFAGAQSEQMYRKMSQAVTDKDVAGAVTAYNYMRTQIEKEYSQAMEDMQKAYEKRDRDAYERANATIRTLKTYRLSKDQSDTLLNAILSEEDPQRTTDAQWLYENSPYYRPVLSLDYSASGDGYRYSYNQRLTLSPGTETTLPSSDDIRFDTSRTGRLAGWGLTPDTITYQPGETITMPLTSQTLYAQWQSGVAFTDPISRTDVMTTDSKEGDEVAVPVPAAPDVSYIFDGWKEVSTGKILDTDATTYTVVGNGAEFQAMWKSLAISDLSARHYSIDALPVDTQVSIGFTLKNQGTESLRDLQVTLSSDDPNVTFLTSTMTYRGLSVDKAGVASGFRVLIGSGAQSGSQIPITITVTDRAGDTWTQTLSCTVR